MPAPLPKSSGAVRLNPFIHASSTAVTRPEMPAVRPEGDLISRAPSLPPTRREEVHEATGRVSWADIPDDPITEQTGRVTEISQVPALVQSRDRALLLRMDGVHAGQVVSLDGHSVTIGRHPQNTLAIDDSGVSRFHAEIRHTRGGFVLEDKGARNGTIVQGSRVRAVIQLNDGDFIQFGPRVGFRFSVTDRSQEKLLKRLYESSNRDALTGAYNRKHFDERLMSEIAYAARHKTSTSLLLFDIDHFKRVNDTYGHAAGDAVLRQVAGITSSRLRTEDVFARVGGEEFAVLLRGVNLAGCARLGERLRSSVAAVPTLFEGRSVPVTISLGCASHACTEAHQGNDLIRIADERLYRAKNSGRNRVISD